MVLIQRTDPLSAASDAVGSYFTAKRQRQLEDAAQAHQAAREKRQDYESDRDYAIRQAEASDVHQRAIDEHSLAPGQLKLQQGEITAQGDTHAAAALQRQKDLADMAYDRAIRPLQIEGERLRNKAESGEILSAQDTHRMNQIEMQIKQVTAAHASQMANLEAALKQAQITSEQASASASRASAYRSMHPVVRESPGERSLDAFNAASEGLTPQGNSFLDMIYGTNNPPTRGQALEALLRSRLSQGDKRNLRTIIESRESQFESPGQQVSQEYRSGRDASKDALQASQRAERRGEQLYHDVARGTAYNALTPRLKSLVHSALVGRNMSVDEAISAVQASGLPDDDKGAILSALGSR